jgi:tRNA(fMet)-specific endonuclease VapC
MTWLLDTSICIGLLRGKAPAAALRLRTIPVTDIVICSVVLYELHLGTEKCNDPATEAARVAAFVAPFHSLPFNDGCAMECARIRAALEKAGFSIGPCDYQIAATAKHHGLTLVTHNMAEFQRVSGLNVENWFGSAASSSG